MRASLFVALVAVASVESRRSVSTVLSAKWSETPLFLETAEFVAEQTNDDHFWSLIDLVDDRSQEWKEKSDQHVYNDLIAVVSKWLSATQLALLKMELSLRTYSPLLQMYREVAADRGVLDLDCDVVLETNNKLFCDLDLASANLAVRDENKTQIFHTDHVYKDAKNGELPLIVLYGMPGQPQFGKFTRQLRKMADDNKILFVYRPLAKEGGRKVRLSGYGLEMQIKSTEYKAQDDSLQSDKESSEEEDLKDEGNVDLVALKPSQMEKLSLQASERVMRSPEKDRLKTLIDIALNFPSRAPRLSRIKVGAELRKESKNNQDHFTYNMNLQPSDAALFINGLFFDMDYVDIFTVLETLKSEGSVIDALATLGLSEQEARKLVALELSTGEKRLEEYGIDIRDSSVQWINDIEKDELYRGWGSSLNELLRPTFPGMLRSIRRNLFSVVIVCDPSNSKSRPLLKLLESFYLHRAPLRVGVVFVTDDKVSEEEKMTGYNDGSLALIEAFNYVLKNKNAAEALAFLTDVYARVGEDNKIIESKDVIETFKVNFGNKIDRDQVFGEDSEYDIGRDMSRDFADRAGMKDLPQVLMNGVPMDETALTEDDFEEALMMRLMRITSEMQKLVYRSQVKDKEDVVDFLMTRPNIMPLLNERVLSSDKAKHIGLCCNKGLALKEGLKEKEQDKSQMMLSMHEELRYFQTEKKKTTRVLTTWIVADLETAQGRQLVRSGLVHIKGSAHIRLALITNSQGFVSRLVQHAVEMADSTTALVQLLSKTLKEETLAKLINGQKKLSALDVPGMDTQKLEKLLEDSEDRISETLQLQQKFVQQVLNFYKGQSGVLVNGKLIGPLDKDESFSEDDFNLLEKYSMSLYGDKLLSTLHDLADTKESQESLLSSDKSMKIASILLSRTSQSKSRHKISFSSDKYSVIKMEPRKNGPSFDLTAIFDPVSRAAQKIAPLLQILHQTLNARVTVYLNAIEKHEELPQKSYYQLVLAPEPSFDSQGQLSYASLVANFTELPQEPLFTMHYHIPDNWLIEPVESFYDLDNIRLAEIDRSRVHSEFELEYLLLEGHCFETMTNSPPRGLQLTLGTDVDPVLEDTIVMANLGYLQLKTRPGRWLLNLHQGRSAELYDIVSHEGTESNRGDKGTDATDIQVLISSFKSKIIKLRVAKKSERRHEDLLDDSSDPSLAQDSDSGTLWDSITTTLSGSPKEEPNAIKKDEDDTLNIFCLASGHLYERLLKIMMLSTIRHTEARVKFWILENFLSPSLKQFLPAFSKHFGFDFQFVQYKWPRWLNQQKEKQRIIWGYKILFLDVMFPLNVKKIIFVDTDQIVRADLTELRDLDLKGAPYGYTPFCDSNEDMEGFRFWKSGYWKSHLAGKPYHISALYVVDLVRFRKLAAGDRLRGQYQALSQDPNSLSNLDQDLPNNMIHQVPIFSLPQEWLWCETWCGSETLHKAKSIDLCNNPLTKEPKLDAARRIVPEWTDYDDEVRAFAQSLKNKGRPQEKSKKEEL